LAKRLTDKQKTEITQSFMQGSSVDDLSKIYKCTNLTISRNLKKILGDKKYKDIIDKKNNLEKSLTIKKSIPKDNVEKKAIEEIDIKNSLDKNSFCNVSDEEVLQSNTFFEIPPLEYEIDNTKQKDLSSIPLSQVNLPNVVYMIVDKKIELEVKYLKDYPSWQFLSDDELNRKTIEIHFDMKIAKRLCNKEQKLIKVPNTDVFKIAAPFLISIGITRIVSPEKLIAL
tara:strand:- start:930 stop:1610 length:681 start_codon:yes stop_codon:yes gene_type:complete